MVDNNVRNMCRYLLFIFAGNDQLLHDKECDSFRRWACTKVSSIEVCGRLVE